MDTHLRRPRQRKTNAPKQQNINRKEHVYRNLENAWPCAKTADMLLPLENKRRWAHFVVVYFNFISRNHRANHLYAAGKIEKFNSVVGSYCGDIEKVYEHI